MSTTYTTKLNILIADDSAPDRLLLESIVTRAGYNVLVCKDGVEAIEVFKSKQPDIILLDVLMPNMGGIEAAREIRRISAGEFIPIIFITALTDNDALVECIEAGGDDFATKPYNHVVLQSKIKAFRRMREMHSTLVYQKDEIEKNNRHLIQEQRVAKQVFDKIAHSGCLNLDFITHYMSPLAVFNGDVLVAEISPTGSIMILLGDFTGHGLPAAIGSIPLATTFYGMVRKGFSLEEILKEINDKLHQTLPIGFFCCATFVDINFVTRRMRLWNGGLPESVIYRKSSNEVQKVCCHNLPLGVIGNKDFHAESKRFNLEIGDQFYMWSDGILEARNHEGEMYGENRHMNIIERYKGSAELFSEMLLGVQDHVQDRRKDDDISLVGVDIQNIDLLVEPKEVHTNDQAQLADWSAEFTFEETSLRQFDPLPLLINIISEVPGLRDRSTSLYTVLAELYANALEHGVLELDSSLKATPEGFANFYREKSTRLENLKKGHVKVNLLHRVERLGGILTIKMRDTGAGFPLPNGIAGTNLVELGFANEGSTEAKPSYCGRGFSLLVSLCERVIVHHPGNFVEVDFRWYYDE